MVFSRRSIVESRRDGVLPDGDVPPGTSDTNCHRALKELMHHLLADACVLLDRPIPLEARGNPLEMTVEDAELSAAALRASPGHRERSLALLGCAAALSGDREPHPETNRPTDRAATIMLECMQGTSS